MNTIDKNNDIWEEEYHIIPPKIYNDLKKCTEDEFKHKIKHMKDPLKDYGFIYSNFITMHKNYDYIDKEVIYNHNHRLKVKAYILFGLLMLDLIASIIFYLITNV